MFVSILATIAKGLPLTLVITAGAFAIGATIGIPLAVGLRSPSRLVRLPVRLVVNLVRSVPVLVWLFLLYFGVYMGSFRFDPLPAAIVVLAATTSCYLAETYRSAMDTISRGQFEASRALGLSRFTELVHVIVPQMFRVALPAMSTFALVLIKDSSIPSVIGVADITHETTEVARTTGEGLMAYIGACVFYLGLSVLTALAARLLGARLNKGAAR